MLLKQFKQLLDADVPSSVVNGRYCNDHIKQSWIHFNLREQAEILQIIMILLHIRPPTEKLCADYIVDFLDTCHSHGFGRKQKYSYLLNDFNQDLVEAVGQLEAVILVKLMDLPQLTGHDHSKHALFKDSKLVPKLDKAIFCLGKQAEHGPVMLSWMLARYLVDGESTLSNFHALGERALQLRAIHFLERTISNEVITSGSALYRGFLKNVCYSVISVLVSVFEPQKMGITVDIQGLSEKLLNSEAVANDVWKQGLDTGVGTHLASAMANFPANTRSMLYLCTSLGAAGSKSALHVYELIKNMTVFAEPMESVPQDHVQQTKGDNQYVLTTHHCPSIFHSDIVLRSGSVGVLNGNVFQWSTSYDGWQYLMAEVSFLIKQVSSGSQNVHATTMNNVLATVRLLEALFRTSPTVVAYLGQWACQHIFGLVEYFSRVSNPPLDLMASCLRVLSLIALTDHNPQIMWKRLTKLKIFPYTLTPELGATIYNGSTANRDKSVDSGVVGMLLAQQESVNGEYPLFRAFLDLLLTLVKAEASITLEKKSSSPAEASLLYVIKDIFPSYDQWRFSEATEKKIVGQKLLTICLEALKSTNSGLSQLVGECLLLPAPAHTLLSVVATGDKVIQSLIESQSSWEGGVGNELADLVTLAMDVFNELLKKSSNDELNDLSRHLSSPAPGSQPHFLLTMSQYIYHVNNTELPISAMTLLATIGRTFPMSLLACLGEDAEAARDALIFRLSSHTESVKLKIAIIDFFTACIDGQPGFLQMLIGAKEDVNVVNSTQKGNKGAQDCKNDKIQLVSESGCLDAIMSFLKDSKDYPAESKDLKQLHLSIAFFILHLFSQQCVIAMEHLKRQKSFWTDLTWPLFDPKSVRSNMKLNACILRILAVEIYTYGGKIDQALKTILEKFCHEKENHLSNWCDLVLDQVAASQSSEDTFIMPSPDNTNDYATLLGAWKAFIIILSKDQPVGVSPSQCHLVASSLIKAIRLQLVSTSGVAQNVRVTTSLSEVCLVLMQRWQTKCADNMEKWCADHLLLLQELLNCFEELHSRSRAAILAILNTALRTSAFKLDKEDEVLRDWLDPAAELVIKSFRSHQESEKKSGDLHRDEQKVPILCITLLKSLIQRFSDSHQWFPVIHQRLLLQAILSKIQHTLSEQGNVEILYSALGLLLTVAKSKPGYHAILATDLTQLLWMPLSEVKQATPEWISVFQLAILLAITLLRNGQYEAVENSLTVVALLQDQLTTFLLAPKVSIQQNHIEIMVTSVTFIGMFMKFHQQWQISHSSSLLHFYRTVCLLIHVCTCLLIRPSLLDMLITRTNKPTDPSACIDAMTSGGLDDELRRMRRLSSTDAELATHPVGNCNVETTHIQNCLLDAISCGLSMLRVISPSLFDIASGDLFDHNKYEHLLGMAFSSPTFEQEDGLTYGTLVSVANLCIRALTRTDRSPSPSTTTVSSSLSPQIMHRMGWSDKKRLMLVLEQSLVVLLSQALLVLYDPNRQPREKQFLKRELGAEMSSFIDCIRRHFHRGGAGGGKSPQLGTAASPLSSLSGTRSSSIKADDQFIKVIGQIVQNVFSE